MKCKRTITIYLIIMFSVLLWSSNQTSSSEKLLKDLDSLKSSMATYENLFQLNLLYGDGWTDLKKRIDNLKKKIGTEIVEDNINTAVEQYKSIRNDLEKCLNNRGEENHKIFSYISSRLNPSPGFSLQVEGYIMAISAAFSRNVITKPIKITEPCLEDAAIYARACRAESYAKDYSQKSAQYSKQISLALRLFDRVRRSTCLDKLDSRVIYAKSFIIQKKKEIEGKIKIIKQNPSDSSKKRDLMLSIHPEELVVLKNIDKMWFNSLNIDINMFKTVQPFTSKVKKIIEKRPEKNPAAQKIIPSKKNKIEIKDLPKSKELKSKYPLVPHIGGKVRFPMTLDVWQSAWGDFSTIDVLIRYLNRNRIKKINLNPGLPMGPKFYADGYKKFKPLVSKFYANGITKIGFLYAELNYPIEYFARFLRTHYKEFKIDTIVDDSEFTDLFKDRFERNIRLVKRWGIKYSAFVTLESVGNSGVSDSTRYWVLDNVDYPILMSYFGCTLEDQINKLEKYLSYADRKGKRGQVGIAILLGSKKVGREVSCERLLNPSQLKRFLYQLHRWAIQNHPSYGGIVLETNLKMPKVDVSWNLK